MIKKFLFLFLLLNNIAYCGTRDPNTPDSSYIEYGKKYKCVVRISSVMEDDKKSCGSAVIISQKWVLTAAHVIKNTKENKIILDNNKEIEVEKVFIPKEFNDEFGFYDIALCKLKKDVELDFYPELYENNDEVGKIAGLSGFGITGTFLSRQKFGDELRRAGSNMVDGVDRQLLICSPSRTNKTELEFLTAHGDSGGGLFINKKLAGIHSCVIATDEKPDSSYGDESGHTRVSIHQAWIRETIESN